MKKECLRNKFAGKKKGGFREFPEFRNREFLFQATVGSTFIVSSLFSYKIGKNMLQILISMLLLRSLVFMMVMEVRLGWFRNLVCLLGFCLEGTERILVYEFVSNGSLDQFIFDSIKRGQLNWEMCYKIICGIARGILYLHEDSRLWIVHRDLKASNVLLDEEMNPKISDFGMARLFAMNQIQGNTRRTVGTCGYMAPEYALHGQFSVKSDVFSFGVLLLETVIGKRNSWMNDSGELEHLPSYAWKNWREGRAENLIDPTLRSNSKDEIIRCIHIGLLCVQEHAAKRPTMASVVLMLNSNSLSLPPPLQPAFLMYGSISDAGLSQSEENSGSSQPVQSTDTDATPFFPVNFLL